MSEANAQKKKGLGILGWLLIGCAGILVLGAVGLTAVGVWGFGKVKEFSEELENNPAAAVETMVKLHPEVDHVSTDKDAQTVTIRDRKTGKTYTLDFDQIREGRFNIESADGTVRIDASAAGTDGGSMRIETDKGSAVIGGKDGTMTIQTDEGTSVFGAADAEDIPDWVPMLDGELSGAYRSETPQQRAGGIGIERAGGDLLEDYKALLEEEGFKILNFTVSGSSGMIHAAKGDDRFGITMIAQGDGKAMIQYIEKLKP